MKRNHSQNKTLWLSLFTLFIGSLIAWSAAAETEKTSEKTPDATVQSEERNANSPEMKESEKIDAAAAEDVEEGEEINGSADTLERYEKDGITVLTGNVKILRTDGYLNADKVTFYTDPITGDTVRTVAESNVEIRDAELFATCEHATMNHLTNTIILKTDVVVIQNKDRLETVLFTYNRTTGEQTAEGDVKFKVRVIEAEPVPAEESSKADAETDEKATADTADDTDEKETETGEADAPPAPEEGEAAPAEEDAEGNPDDASTEEDARSGSPEPNEEKEDAENETDENE